MKNRIPTELAANGALRYGVYDKDGNLLRYEYLKLEDNPTNPGTILAKETLLKDATAALFGLDENSVPDDAFAFLGKYNQHWWKRVAQELKTVYIGASSKQTIEHYVTFTFANVYYSDSYTVDPDTGEVALVNPKVATDRTDFYGRYAKSVNGGITFYDKNANPTPASDTDVFYMVNPTGTFSSQSNGKVSFSKDHIGLTRYYSTATEVNVGEVGYVQSSDRNAYPDSGESDGYEWQYLGVPFENAVTAPKIVTGSYIGTGKYGTSNKNTLTFDSEPKMVFVTEEFREDDGSAYTSTGWVIFTQTDVMGYAYYNYSFGNESDFSMTPNWGKVLKWWSTDSADVQGNTAGTKYRYVAIC